MKKIFQVRYFVLPNATLGAWQVQGMSIIFPALADIFLQILTSLVVFVANKSKKIQKLKKIVKIEEGKTHMRDLINFNEMQLTIILKVTKKSFTLTLDSIFFEMDFFLK